MPERGFDTEFWTNPKIKKLPMEVGHLYLYLWTNAHCNQAGLYYIALDTIASESKLSAETLPHLFDLLKGKVVWYPDEDLVWVKNFLKRQSKSPKFLAAAAKCLVNINNHKAVEALLSYNTERYSISIPYQYYIDRIRMPSSAGASASSSADLIKEGGGEGKGVVKGGDPQLAENSRLFEENIGKITEMVANRLKDITDTYPPDWFKEAVDEAVGAGVRRLNYIEAILERWQREGFKSKKGGPTSETHKRGTKQPTAEEYRQSLNR